MHRSLLPVSAALIAAASSFTAAGPLDKSRVPADASWLVHLDAEAMLKSSISKALIEGEGQVDLDELEDFKEEFGLDPMRDVMDATVFGWDAEGEDAVAVLSTSSAIDEAIERFKAKGHEYRTISEGGYDLYAWDDGGHTQYGLVRKSGAERRLVYLSRDKSRLIGSADLAGGRGESLKGRKGSALAGEPGAGAILFVATDVIPSHGHDGEMSMVLGKARAVRLELGERGDECYGDLQLTMATSEDATNVVQILTGLQAMARMFCQNNPELAPVKELLDAQSLSTKESAILAHISYPTDKLVEAIKAAQKEEAADEDDGDDDDDRGEKDGAKEPL